MKWPLLALGVGCLFSTSSVTQGEALADLDTPESVDEDGAVDVDMDVDTNDAHSEAAEAPAADAASIGSYQRTEEDPEQSQSASVAPEVLSSIDGSVDVSSLEDQVAVLQRHMQDLQTKLAVAQSEKRDLSSALNRTRREAATKQAAAVQNATRAMSTQLQQRNTELASLRDELSKETAQDKERGQTVKVLKARARAANIALKRKAKVWSRKEHELKIRMVKDESLLQAENRSLVSLKAQEQRLEASSKANLEAKDEEIAKLSKELKRVEESAKTAKEALVQAKRRALGSQEALQSQLELAQKQIVALTKSKELLEQSNRSAQQEEESLKRDVLDLKNKLAMAKMEDAELSKKFKKSQFEAKKEAAKALANVTANLTSQLHQEESEVKLLRQRAKKAAILENREGRLLKKLRSSLVSSRSKFANASKAWAQKESSLDKQLQQEKALLHQENDAMQQIRLQQASLLNATNSEKDAKAKEILELRTSLRNLQDSEAKLESEAKKHRSMAEGAQEVLRQKLEHETQEVAYLRKSRDDLSNRFDALTNSSFKLEAELKEQKAEHLQLRGSTSKLEAEKRRAESSLDQLQKEARSLKSQLAQEDSKLAISRDELRRAEESSNSSQAIVKSLSQEVSQLLLEAHSAKAAALKEKKLREEEEKTAQKQRSDLESRYAAAVRKQLGALDDSTPKADKVAVTSTMEPSTPSLSVVSMAASNAASKSRKSASSAAEAAATATATATASGKKVQAAAGAEEEEESSAESDDQDSESSAQANSGSDSDSDSDNESDVEVVDKEAAGRMSQLRKQVYQAMQQSFSTSQDNED